MYRQRFEASWKQNFVFLGVDLAWGSLLIFLCVSVFVCLCWCVRYGWKEERAGCGWLVGGPSKAGFREENVC